MPDTIFPQVFDAQSKITDVLKELEKTTGRKVASIEIERLNMTTCGDAVPRYLRSVKVELEPLHNDSWSG